MYGVNKVHIGEASKVMSEWPGNFIDMSIQSPPYSTMREYQGYEFDFKKIAKQLERTLKPGGVIVWVVADKFTNGSKETNSWKQVDYFKELGLNFHDHQLYLKNNPLPVGAAKRLNQFWENIYVFSKGTPKTFNPITAPAIYKGLANVRNRGKDNKGTYKKVERKPFKKVGNVFYPSYTLGKGHQGFCKEDPVHAHPAIFPLKLALDQISMWSNCGDVVLDCFAGSGQSCIAAHSLYRNWIYLDISKEYGELFKERLELWKNRQQS